MSVSFLMKLTCEQNPVSVSAAALFGRNEFKLRKLSLLLTALKTDRTRVRVLKTFHALISLLRRLPELGVKTK